MSGVTIVVSIAGPRGKGLSEIRNVAANASGELPDFVIAEEAKLAAHALARRFFAVGDPTTDEPAKRPFDASKTHKLIDCRDLVELRRLAREVRGGISCAPELAPAAGALLRPLLRKIDGL